MNITIEIIAFAFSLVSVYGLGKEKVYGWYTGLVGVSAFFYLFYVENLYMDMWLQVIFFIQSIVGIYNWKFKKDETKINVIPFHIFIFHISCVLFIGGMIGKGLHSYTDASQPYLDSVLTMACLLGTYYLTKKTLQSWIIWITVDILYLFLFYNQEMWITLGLYVLFLANSIKTYIQWKKMYKNIKTD